LISRAFEYLYDAEWRTAHPSITRWYDTVRNQSIYSDVAEKKDFIEKAIPNVAPKKEEKPKEAKAQQPKQEKKKKEADDEEEDDKPAEPKAKHPLEALPKATFVLDDW
jgi:elongation factor 1-gamma